MTRFNCLKVLVAFVLVNCSVAEQKIGNFSNEGSLIRKPKFYQHFLDKLIPYFVNIANDPCLTIDGTVSTCLRRDQCSDAFGIPRGPCAKGLAVCCEFNVTCQGHVSQNLTWFRNPMYPQKINTSKEYTCPLRIKRPENVGQLLLNIHTFHTAQPYSEIGNQEQAVVGSCQNDSLTITGSDVDIPKLCGNLSNQHIYLNFNENSQYITLTMVFAKSQLERTWNIQLVMIPFDSPWKAPSGCLQYFTGITGRVMSFNYPVRHLASLSYSVCVRNEAGMSFINWSGCADYENPVDFSLSTEKCDPQDPNKPEENYDYITIMDGEKREGAANDKITKKDRFCSLDFNLKGARMSVKSKTRPFLLRFTSDENEKEKEGIRGFCLRFEQSSK